MRTQIKFENLSPKEFDKLCHDEEASADELLCNLYDPHSDHTTTVKVIDDSMDDKQPWYIIGHEYGPTHLIRSWNESDAYDIWRDEQPTIPADEVHEAYGAFDKLVKWLESKGHENTIQLRGFCNRYAPLYFAIATHNANETGAWDNWPLIEGYEMQSNSTGTGIVNVGHYAWKERLLATNYEAKLSGTIS